MLKVLAKQWCKNRNQLKNYLKDNYGKLNLLTYKDIVKIAFEQIYENEPRALDLERVTEIDDGDYQGTLLFIIPFKTYQPSHYEYLMTYIEYGSCSSCDTLQSLQADCYYYGYDAGQAEAEEDFINQKINGFMHLCKDILCNTIKPYGSGWRNTEEWSETQWEGEF